MPEIPPKRKGLILFHTPLSYVINFIKYILKIEGVVYIIRYFWL